VSFSDLAILVGSCMSNLIRYGVVAGDRVVVVAPNSIATVAIYFACARLGAIWVGVNPSAPAAEQVRQCQVVDPVLIIVDSAPDGLSRHVRVLSLEAAQCSRTDAVPASRPPLDTPCAIAFTSGTTAQPKPVVHTRAAVSLTAAALAAVDRNDTDRVGVVLPMSIHNVLVVGVIASLVAGATAVLVDRFNAVAVAAACRERRLTELSALVPATVYDLVRDHNVEPGDLASLRHAGVGGAGLQEDIRNSFEAKFAVRLVGSYGMTEAPGPVCLEHPAEIHRPGSSGLPLPHVVVDAVGETNRPARAGETGRLRVCPSREGPFAGLFRPPAWAWVDGELQSVAGAGTCLHTSDFGWIDDDGSVYVSTRDANVIVRGGVNVNTGELESILGLLPELREVAVVGEADDRLGERIVAYVELAPGADIGPDWLHQQARALLSHGKSPDEFVVTTLPRNTLGKVVRRLLTRP
jgi:acyl-coenzyme A synthetase/AMP-(fatty) acid ligase